MVANILQIRNIPYMTEEPKIEEWNVKFTVLGSILSLHNCRQFLSLTKDTSLPITGISGIGGTTAHSTDEAAAVVQHNLALHVFVLACHKSVELTTLIQQTESTVWPGGEMHAFMNNIEKYFKLTLTSSNNMKQEIKKEGMLDDIKWPRSENPHKIWKRLAALSLRFKLTSPITENDKMKWISKHAPSGYSDVIRNAPMKLKSENQDWAYDLTYEDMQNELNEKFEDFEKATKKRAELSLLTAGGRGDYGGNRNGNGNRGGGRGRGQQLSRKEQSKRDKATHQKKNKNGNSPTDSGKVRCYYCGDPHYKNKCEKFKKEGDKLFCTHCDANGQDEPICVWSSG